MNRNCSICNIKIDENNYLKHRTICKICQYENRRKNNNTTITEIEIDTTPQQPKILNVNNKNTIVSKCENLAKFVIGPRNFGKTFYMLKMLEKLDNKRPIQMITRSPNQCPNYKTSTKIKPINKYKGSVYFLMTF